MPPIRRKAIRFRDFGAVRTHLEGLAGRTLTTTGGWQAGQIYYHLAAAFEVTSTPSRSRGRWWVRLTKLPQRLLVQYVGFPSGVGIPVEQLKPPPDVDEVEQLARLHRAIDAFAAKQDHFPSHPYFGPLNREQWRRFHLRHCELHLDHITAGEPRAR